MPMNTGGTGGNNMNRMNMSSNIMTHAPSSARGHLIYLFVIDTCLPMDEMEALKDNVSRAL